MAPGLHTRGATLLDVNKLRYRCQSTKDIALYCIFYQPRSQPTLALTEHFTGHNHQASIWSRLRSTCWSVCLLLGPQADSCFLPSRFGLYRGKRQLNASASGAGAPKRQPHACRDWPGEAPSAKTPLVYASRLTIREYTGKCYSIIAVNKVSTSLVISYALLRIPTNIKRLLTLWYCENNGQFTRNMT